MKGNNKGREKRIILQSNTLNKIVGGRATAMQQIITVDQPGGQEMGEMTDQGVVGVSLK